MTLHTYLFKETDKCFMVKCLKCGHHKPSVSAKMLHEGLIVKCIGQVAPSTARGFELGGNLGEFFE